MDAQLLFSSLRSQQSTSSALQHHLFIDHLTPYFILIVNYVLFQLARSLANRLLPLGSSGSSSSRRLLRLFAHELISTCELCADCAELNVVYEKHGSLAYGASLTLLTYLWMETFGEAHTSPGYLVEDYFCGPGRALFKTGDTYARFIGQSAAMPLAWRLASLWWRYELVVEHRSIADVASCKSSLTTTTLNGFLIELLCCLLCRLAELVGHKLLERQYLGRRAMSAACSFFCSLLVVLALELSGGYFNPVLAGALEYGCQGASAYQHAFVFWLGPLIGHVLARLIFRRLGEQLGPQQKREDSDKFKQTMAPRRQQHQQQNHSTNDIVEQQSRRQTRSTATQRRKKSDKID